MPLDRALNEVIVGDSAPPVDSATLIPGVMLRMAPAARVTGSASMTSDLMMVSFRAFCTSTTGVSPVTVIVSSRPPTFISAAIVSVWVPESSTLSRLTVLKPGNVNVSEYVPGRRSMMRYWPEPSVTADLVFSISAGLDASTVTPGRTAPDASLTVPVRAACAKARVGSNTIAAATASRFTTPYIKSTPRSRKDQCTQRPRPSGTEDTGPGDHTSGASCMQSG